MWETLTYTSGLDIYFFGLEINNSKNTLYMASLDVGGFCSGIKKSNYLPKDVSHTTTITQRMQIPKKTQILFDFPVLHSKAFLLQVVIFSHNNAKKNPGSRNGGSRSGGRELIKKGIKCFTYQRKKEHHLKLLNIARIEETCIHFA